MIVQVLHNTAQYWEVKQFHYLNWNDHSFPDSNAIMLFLKDVKSWHHKVSGPKLVHCR